MSEFKEQFDRTGVPSLLRRFGDLILYSDPSITEPVEVTAKLTSEKQERRYRANGWEAVTTRQARVQTAELAITFRLDGKLVADGKNYAIDNVRVLTNGFTLLDLTRSESGEITRVRYRGRDR